jgi:hypothetical protein
MSLGKIKIASPFFIHHLEKDVNYIPIHLK